MRTFLLIDGENFKGKVKEIFKNVGKNKPIWHKYNFKGLLDKVLQDIEINKSIFYFAKIKENIQTREKSKQRVYLGFESHPNKGLTFTTNRTILIRNSEIIEFGKF